MKQKTAYIESFTPLVVIAFIIAMTSFLAPALANYNSLSKERAIGESALEVIRAQSEGEKALFFIDGAVGIVAEDAVRALALNGGAFDGPCEYTDDGYVLWQYRGESCFEEMKKQLGESYKSLFNNQIKGYFSQYPEDNVRMLVPFDIILTEGSLKITGTALDSIIIGLPKQTLLFLSTESPSSVSVEEYTNNPALATAIAANSYSRNNVEYIMLHHTAGSTIEGALSAFRSRGVSCHYVVGKDGKIVQAVPEGRGAYCAGSGIISGMNTKAIGIEIVNLGNGKDPYPPEQVEAVRKLVIYLMGKYDIQPGHLVGHGWYTDRKLPCEPCGFDYSFIPGWKVLTKADRVTT